ncbi:zinc metalloprotease [Kineococcus rubinsiae]|uniref:zinc metalloprotease n=1 Tax=Kineococcus rubinsiae TaxID=2609562 RepID=UPI00142F7CAD|nr:zinc metalloprotease [Kineococcus rubinsiae]
MSQATTDDAPRRRCGTTDVHVRLLEQDPDYRSARASIAQARTAATARTAPGTEEVVRIPVVVHVVSPSPQDVTDEQVAGQVAVLNADFRAANTDLDAVPEPFRPLVGDARVEFVLATTAPDGSPSTGTTRTSTDVAEFTTDDAVKAAATGGADPWPVETHLNLWVCPLGGGLLGYAQFPGGPPATDGVVVNITAFGTTGTASAPFDLGRTATHEVGHYLDLFHLWGEFAASCEDTDEVDDTPNQGGPNHGRPAFPHVSCDNGPDGDLFVDYMDYVDDAAMVMFTAGQVTRMRAALAGARAPLAAAGAGPSGSPATAGTP